jgi:hypothetical protein
MAATVSALRVVAPVARVAARKATAARTALVVKVRETRIAIARHARTTPARRRARAWIAPGRRVQAPSLGSRARARASPAAPRASAPPRPRLTFPPSPSRHAPPDSRFARAFDVVSAHHSISSRVRHQPARVSVRAAASESDVGDRLTDALKIAEECVDECAAMWDEVEELSQAASDKKPAPEELEPAPISQADMDFIKATQAALADAKKGAGEIDVDTLRALETASASAKKVTVSSDRLKALETALEAALASAKECTGEDCAVEWEAVEEISAAKSRAENTD